VAGDFLALAVDFVLRPLDHVVDAALDRIKPGNDLIGERMVMPTFGALALELGLEAFQLRVQAGSGCYSRGAD
jgi:hypothetical protein